MRDPDPLKVTDALAVETAHHETENVVSGVGVEASGVEVLLYEDKGHRSFTGRHAYFHDPDGNAIEFIDFHGIGDITAPDYEGRERRRARSHLKANVPAQG